MTWRIASASQACRIARTDGGRLRQASEPDWETASTRQQTCTGNPWAAITWMAANRRKGPPPPASAARRRGA